MAGKDVDLLIEALKAPEELYEEKMVKYFDYIKITEMFTGYLFSNFERILKENEECTRTVCRLIRENDCVHLWNNDENIESSCIVEILNIPVIIPSVYRGFLSGEYILYLLHGDNIRYYIKAIEANMMEDYIQADYQKLYEKFIGDNEDSYLSRMKKYFYSDIQIDLSLLNMPSFTHGFDNRKLDEHEIYSFLEMWNYLVVKKIIPSMYFAKRKYWQNRLMNGRGFQIEIENEQDRDERIWIIYRTLLMQNIRSEDLDRLDCIQNHIYELYKIMYESMKNLIYIHSAITLERYIKKDIPNKWVENDGIREEVLNLWLGYISSKLHGKFFDVEKKLQIKPHKFLLETSWRLILMEYTEELSNQKNILNIRLRENKIEDVEGFIKTCCFDEIGVNNWKDFSKKYKRLLSGFEKYPKSLSNLWMKAVGVIIYLSKMDRRIPKEVPKTESGRKKETECCVAVENIKVVDLLSMMKLLVVANDVQVKVKGTNSKKYLRLDSDVSVNQYTLGWSMRNIENQYSEELRECIRSEQGVVIMKMLFNKNDYDNLESFVGLFYDKVSSALRDISDISNNNRNISSINWIGDVVFDLLGVVNQISNNSSDEIIKRLKGEF